MKIVVVSDVHIKNPGDQAESLLLKGLGQIKFQRGDKLMLLGDIFDLLVGDFQEYFIQYQNVLNSWSELLRSGIEVHYFEGNHDFHIQRPFQRFFKEDKNFFFHKGFHRETLGGKEILFCHGDDIEIDNPSYKIYKALINNKIMEFVAYRVVPYRFVDWIGKKASLASRENNENKYKGLDEGIKKRFRGSFISAINKYQFDWLVCGHSHMADDFLFEGRRYLNNGHFLSSKTFLIIDESGVQWKPVG